MVCLRNRKKQHNTFSQGINPSPCVPSGDATSALKTQFPFSSLRAYPAIGVRQDPSNFSRKALSQETANLVSS